MSPASLLALAAFCCALALIVAAALAGAAKRGDEQLDRFDAARFSNDWWAAYEESEAS